MGKAETESPYHIRRLLKGVTVQAVPIQSPYVCGLAVTLTTVPIGALMLGPRGHQELGSVKLERRLSQPQRRGCKLQARAPPTRPHRRVVEAMPETLLPGPQTMGTSASAR